MSDIMTAKQYTAENYLSEVDNLKSIDTLVQTQKDYQCGKRKELWPTGFPLLDEMLDGGLHGSQLCCVGAISSLGKTTWVLQIATQIAEQQKDVLIFSLEMSREELNAKTISRYSYIRGLEEWKKANYFDRDEQAFTTNEILKGNVDKTSNDGSLSTKDVPFSSMTAYIESVNRAIAVAPYTYIVVGNNDISVDDIKRITELHIQVTGRKPVVIIDYLQIISPSQNSVEKHFDTRRSTDDDITSLKVLARNKDIPVIVISAFSRASYNETVSMSSFRESSGIEYSADVLFGLQYDNMDYQPSGYYDEKGNHVDGVESRISHTVRVNKLFEEMQNLAADGKEQPIELKILKNRNGARGSVYFKFTPRYNYFEEVDAPGHNKKSMSSSKKDSSDKRGQDSGQNSTKSKKFSFDNDDD